MVMSAFSQVAQKLRDSKFVIPVCLATILGVIVGAYAFYEDYQSSFQGYSMLPTRKSGVEIIEMIALLPQIGQIIFFYMFGNSVEVLPNGRRRVNYLYFFIAFFLLLFDMGTDMYFKASGMDFVVWVIAFIESITVFTIGSEMLLTASIGILFELAPEAMRQLAQIFGRMFEEDEPPQSYKNR
jgi:hypothetical protein